MWAFSSHLQMQHNCSSRNQLPGRTDAHRCSRPGRIRRSTAQSGDGKSAQPFRAEMLNRIRRAKEYRGSAGAARAEEDRARLDQQVSSFAADAAAKEEQAFTAALAERQQTAAEGAAEPQRPSGPAPVQKRQSATGESLREAAMRRIAAARRSTAGNASGTPSSEPSAAPAAAASSAPPSLSAPQADAAMGTSMDWGQSSVGSAEQAAPFLREVVQHEQAGSSGDGGGGGISAGLSAEQFSLAKEEAVRARGAEIITADGSYQAGSQGSGGNSSAAGDGEYRPKVASWGVWPRPANISEQYGGGRTLRPGEALETEAETLARKQRVAAALSTYKKAAGLEVDPAAEAAAKLACARGEELMRRGQLSEALGPFDEAVALVSSRSRVGGEATLQKAICLDSMGRNEEAMALYKSISRHSAPGVAKKAKQMLFGFDSMTFLKTHTMSYGINREAYQKYFTRLTGQWDNMYVAREDEDAGASVTMATVVATAVMMAPLVLVGVKVGSRLLRH